MNGKREFGDYQTPRVFAEKICSYLKNTVNVHPSVVVEPTCGIGNFLQESLSFSAKKYYGIEINKEYCRLCRNALNDRRIEIINSDFFSFPLDHLIENRDDILIIGNPPWVTNTELSSAEALNLPEKSNFKNRKGFDAITGCSNFDICEYMILKIIKECRNTNATIAMLCKNSVARNIYQEIIRENIPFYSYRTLTFDSSKIFGVNASACLMLLQLSRTLHEITPYEVADFDFPEKIIRRYYCRNNSFYTTGQESICDFDGHCCFEWRQGIKHDCSRIVELTLKDGSLVNGLTEKVSIESDCLYPLVKSSMIKNPITADFSKFLIVTQKQVNEDPGKIASVAPRTWDYLVRHREFFEKRKSIIYAKSPHFSMFGIGEYSFAKYKVAISGFYKTPLFSVIYNEEKPVMLDDTCYFLSFSSFESAYVTMLLLNDERVQAFLKNTAFLDSKRPFTKKVLQRLDFAKIVRTVNFTELMKNEEKMNIPKRLTQSMYHHFLLDLNVQDLFSPATELFLKSFSHA